MARRCFWDSFPCPETCLRQGSPHDTLKIMNTVIVIFFTIWLIIVWVGTIWFLRMGWKSFKRDYLEKSTRVRAKVVAKDENTVFLPDLQMEGTTYEIAFECPDGEVMIYDVPERLYTFVSPGEVGILVRQGGRFIEFEGPSGASEGEDDVFRRMIRS